MAARAATRGLSADDVATIRDQLTAGRRPRVVFTEAAGQIVGQIGQVVAVGDPAESDEFLVVRFGKDELPFSPGDLQVAPRGAVARKPGPPPAPAVPDRVEPEFLIDKPLPAVKSARASTAAGRAPDSAAGASGEAGPPEAVPAGSGVGAAPSKGSRASAPARSAASPAAVSPKAPGAAAPPASPSASASAEGVSAPRKGSPAGRAAKPKVPAGLTVTLAYADGEWTVSAMQGSKSLARPYVVRPAEALRMVALVDVPGVREAVEHIMAAERAEAQAQADRLRAELAEVEARLAELP